MEKYSIFFISDHTGITVETLGYSVLTQFSGLNFEFHAIPFMNSLPKAEAARAEIDADFSNKGVSPVVFSSVTNVELRMIIKQSNAVVFDLFEIFLPPLENAFEQSSIHALGKSHGMSDSVKYGSRIEALNFALNSDDGVNFKNYNRADIILVGVSRTGKTPTCLYLALQFGIFASNYPMTDGDLETFELTKLLRPYRDKLYGLTIEPGQLQRIRQERKPDSVYASLQQCQKEVRTVVELFNQENIPYLDVTNFSVEEISTTIMYEKGWQRGQI